MTLERPTFSSTSLREGYDTAEVDRAVDLILSNLALPELRFGADQITTLRFTPVRLQQGYDMGEVDGWLDLAAAETERRSAEGTSPLTSRLPRPHRLRRPRRRRTHRRARRRSPRSRPAASSCT